MGESVIYKQLIFYLDQIGIDRVILGTAAIENPEFFKKPLFKNMDQNELL